MFQFRNHQQMWKYYKTVVLKAVHYRHFVFVVHGIHTLGSIVVFRIMDLIKHTSGALKILLNSHRQSVRKKSELYRVKFSLRSSSSSQSTNTVSVLIDRACERTGSVLLRLSLLLLSFSFVFTIELDC